MNSLETILRSRFSTREEVFTERDVELRLLLPQSAEDLLDEEAFARDERMPYWAELWPSARALARWFVSQPPLSRHIQVMELGCGVGLPSLIVQSQGRSILATDHSEDALLFAKLNAIRNGLGDLQTQLLDWRAMPTNLGLFNLVIAADVLYEQRNGIALLDLLPHILQPAGQFILADPGRRWAGEFRRRMRAAQWVETELDLIEEPPLGRGVASLVQITRWQQAPINRRT